MKSTKNNLESGTEGFNDITVDQLALMCHRQFADIAEEFTAVHNDIGSLRSDIVDLRSEMNYRFDTEVKPLRGEIREIKHSIEGISEKMDSIILSHRDHEQRISALELLPAPQL